MLCKYASNYSCGHCAHINLGILRHSPNLPVGGAQEYAYSSCILWDEYSHMLTLAPSAEALQALHQKLAQKFLLEITIEGQSLISVYSE